MGRENRDQGFNAATANSPWRTFIVASGPLELYALQCGHGEFAVENVEVDPVPALHPRLQCGHGEFAVENSSAANSAVPSYCVLQCGHGEFAVENPTLPPLRRPPTRASMRPRRIRRGELPVLSTTATKGFCF